MPVLVYRGYGGRVMMSNDSKPNLPYGLEGKLVDIQISSSYDHIAGRLCLTSRQMRYDGIKLCLALHLKIAKDGKNESKKEINMSEHFPVESLITSTGGVSGHKKMNFLLNLPKDQIFPFPFVSSAGSLIYRLVALVTYDQQQSWDVIATKLLFDFKGYHNIGCLESIDPLIDCKEFLDGKITSIFTITKPVLFVGRDSMVNATLQLEGLLGYNVKVTVTLLRNTQIGENIKTDKISTQKHVDDYNEKIVTLTWNINVPPIATATYTNELTRFYSVRYFVKYAAAFKQLRDGNCDAGVVDGHGGGIVEVKVGTTCDSTFDELSEGIESLKLEASVPSHSQLSSRSGSVVSLETRSTRLAKLFGRFTPKASAPGCSQLSSRFGSVASLQSQPPAYSQLSSRIGSIASLESQPPTYSQLSSRIGSIVSLGTHATNVTTHFGRKLEASAPTCSQLSSRTGSVASLESQPPSYDALDDETSV